MMKFYSKKDFIYSPEFCPEKCPVFYSMFDALLRHPEGR